MKDLREISKNLVMNNTQLTNQKDIIIDKFAKNIINKVFDQLAVIFPAWKNAWPSEKELSMAKLEWTKAFNENNISTLEQIKIGFTKARKVDTDFLPSCGKFISWCSPSAEDLGYPSDQQMMRSCIEYRNNQKMFTPAKKYFRPVVIELCKRIDWWMINNTSSQVDRKKADDHFKEEYLNLVKTYKEPLEGSNERLETKETVEVRKTPEQKEDAKKRHLEQLKEIRQKLKTTKFGE